MVGQGSIILNGKSIPLPAIDEYEKVGIELEDNLPMIYELCRWISEKFPNEIRLTKEQRMVNIPKDLELVLELENWKHADLAEGEKPSEVSTFKEIANCLSRDSFLDFQLSEKANNHRKNWPEGGVL